MRYVVEVRYSLVSKITVHAANEKIAALKAAAVTNSWKGVVESTAISVSEASGETR